MNNDSNSGEKKNTSNKTKTKSNVHKWVVVVVVFFSNPLKAYNTIILDLGRTYINEQFKCGT